MRIIYTQGGDAKITVGNPCLVVDQSTGPIRMPFCHDNDDDGQTWSEPIDITGEINETTGAVTADVPIRRYTRPLVQQRQWPNMVRSSSSTTR